MRLRWLMRWVLRLVRAFQWTLWVLLTWILNMTSVLVDGWVDLLQSVDWGSVADWVAGLGTVAAVVFTGLSIRQVLAKERADAEKERLRHAEKVFSNIRQGGIRDKKGWQSYMMTATLYNGSELPLTNVEFFGPTDRLGVMRIPSNATNDPHLGIVIVDEKDPIVFSRERVTVSWVYADETTKLDDYYLTFTDGSGVTHYRRLSDNSVVSRGDLPSDFTKANTFRIANRYTDPHKALKFLAELRGEDDEDDSSKIVPPVS